MPSPDGLFAANNSVEGKVENPVLEGLLGMCSTVPTLEVLLLNPSPINWAPRRSDSSFCLSSCNLPKHITKTCLCNILQINGYFHLKNLDIFLISPHNIDCGHTLEPPQ